MRLWSIHPQYLDPVGLVALWREGLLAQAVLRGQTRGYTHHPQLTRFREQAAPREAIAAYLRHVADEASRRGYSFDRSKVMSEADVPAIEVTDGQLQFEWEHLMVKLHARNREWHDSIAAVTAPVSHPAFAIVRGPIAGWERVAEHR